MIPQHVLLALADKWEPEASQSPQKYRMATCAYCARPMIRMWHCWLNTGGFKKEIHICRKCYPKLLSLSPPTADTILDRVLRALEKLIP